MKRLISALLLAAMSLSMLAGCGGDAGQQAPDADAAAPDSGAAAQDTNDDKVYKIAMLPKFKGIDYFTACENGFNEACEELGVEYVFDAPTEARVDQQIEFVNTWIAQGYDAILCCSEDAASLSPALREAQDAGVLIVSFDADVDEDARSFFVNQVDSAALGSTMMDYAAEDAGEEGKYAIVTSSLTSVNNMEWVNAAKARQEEKYPNMECVDVVPTDIDQELAYIATQDLIKTYPDLKSIIYMSTIAYPGGCDALEAMNLGGKFTIEGMGTPLAMKSYMDKGTIDRIIFWNPQDLAYLATYATVQYLKDGTLGDTVSAGRLGEKKVDGDQVLLGDPLVIDKDNISEYQF